MIKTGKRKKSNKINGSFTLIENEIHDSKAFQDLTIHARYLYYEFKYRYKGKNKYDIKFTQKEAREIMGINTFIKARNQLIEKGFIDVIQRGGLWKQPTIYGLSERWRKYGRSDFDKKDINKIFPPIFKTKFKKGHDFYGKRKQKQHSN